MMNRHAHTAAAGQPRTCPAPSHATSARPHRRPPSARSSPARDLPARLRPRRDRPPGRRPRLGAEATTVVLRDGSAVAIRQIQATDARLAAGIFAQLSPISRWMRFLAAKNHLTEAELRYLTDIDHHDHEALTALGPAGHGLGVARYIRNPHDPHTAEIAMAIVDDWHGRGLGTQLLTLLSDRPRRAGISRFTALTSADNEAMAGLLRTMHAEVIGRGASTVEYQITLANGADHDRPARRKHEGETR